MVQCETLPQDLQEVWEAHFREKLTETLRKVA